LLAERWIMVSYETVRRWVKHFGYEKIVHQTPLSDVERASSVHPCIRGGAKVGYVAAAFSVYFEPR
jgi:hypothetical protein